MEQIILEGAKTADGFVSMNLDATTIVLIVGMIAFVVMKVVEKRNGNGNTKEIDALGRIEKRMEEQIKEQRETTKAVTYMKADLGAFLKTHS